MLDLSVSYISQFHFRVLHSSFPPLPISFRQELRWLTDNDSEKLRCWQVFGDFFPRSIMGRFHILFATVRGVYLALAIVLTQQRYDVLIVDQLSSPIPILRLCGSRIIFYCHFPDLALSGR